MKSQQIAEQKQNLNKAYGDSMTENSGQSYYTAQSFQATMVTNYVS